MSASKYFNQTARQTRSASKNAILAIKKQSAQTVRRKHVKIEYEQDENTTQKTHEPAKKERTQKAGTTSKYFPEESQPKKLKKESLWEPLNWREQLDNIKTMRKSRDAPVDILGCEKTADTTASPEVIRYQTLLSLMLSSQTKDAVTSAAMEKLKAHGCTVENILATPDEKIGELIFPVGFWKKKIGYIKKATKICQEEYSGDIPSTIEGLVGLPGVGPKMAYICMNVAWDKLTGIGVDTHVHRICNRLGWVKKPTKLPEDTRKAVEEWLPRDQWSDLNVLLVGFGQQTCQPVKPKCITCMNCKICPEGRRQTKGKTVTQT